MRTIKKAQLGSLVKKAISATSKAKVNKVPKKITAFSSEAEKIAAGQKPNLQKAKEASGSLDGTPGLGKKPYSKRGLEMAIERRTNPEAARKKMTKAQREKFDLERSYYKNGGAINKKAKSGAALKKQAAVAIAMKKAGKSPKKAMMGATTKPMMKAGGKMTKCKYGCN